MNHDEIAERAVREYGAMQKPPELATLLTLLKGRRIDSVLEIGGAEGGMLWAWDQIGARHLEVVDTLPRPSLPPLDAEVVWHSRSSSDPGLTLTRPRFDLVMIDGDHTPVGVSYDWLTYGPMGDAVVFHDVARWFPTPQEEAEGWTRGSWHLWETIRATETRGECHTIIDDAPATMRNGRVYPEAGHDKDMGIGLILRPVRE